MRRERAIALALSALIGWQANLQAGEARREAIHRRAESEWREKEPEWKLELRRKLQQKVSFEFVDTPLSDALKFLSDQGKISVILDPREEPWDTPISLKAQDMNMRRALEWILGLADMDYALRNEAVFVSSPEHIAGEVVLKIYDVRDLTMAIKDDPAPGVDLSGMMSPEEAEPVGEGTDARVKKITSSALSSLIQTRIRPGTWAPELGTSIEQRDGRLVVMQRPHIHQEISELLRKFWSRRALQVRVDAQLLSVSEDVLARLRALQKRGEGTVFLRKPQLDLIDEAFRDGEGASLVDATRLSCLNGQRSNTLAGKTLEQKGEKRSLQFRGTILDVRPMVSFDRKYVTLHLRLTRIGGGERPGEPVQVFKFSTTVTCLDTDTVLLAGASLPDGRRLIALVTPTILHLEPAPEE